MLVPSPNVTADHQTKNARYFEAAGGAVVVSEAAIARVPVVVRELLADDARLAAMGEAMRAASKPAAADDSRRGNAEQDHHRRRRNFVTAAGGRSARGP